MTDPMDAFVSLRAALATGAVQLSPCTLHADLKVLLDYPEGTPRFTYAAIRDQKLQGIVLLILVEPVKGVPCFQLGYAVAEDCRSQGLGARILTQALEEFKAGIRGTPMKAFYLEAIVGRDNLPSQRIAQKLISATPEEGIDEDSGEPMLQYFQKVSFEG